MSTSQDLTRALERLKDGGSFTFDELMPLVFGDLRELASRQMLKEAAKHTLQATALVNEVYMKLRRSPAVTWESRAHFFATAAHAMRQVLIDHARTAKREKRGGSWRRRELGDVAHVADSTHDSLDLLALNEALERLGQEYPRQLRVVEMRYFTGLDNEEVAEILGVSTRTVERDWKFAQAWLARELA